MQETRVLDRSLLTIQLEVKRCPTLILIRRGSHRFILGRPCESRLVSAWLPSAINRTARGTSIFEEMRVCRLAGLLARRRCLILSVNPDTPPTAVVLVKHCTSFEVKVLATFPMMFSFFCWPKLLAVALKANFSKTFENRPAIRTAMRRELRRMRDDSEMIVLNQIESLRSLENTGLK